MKKRYLSKTSLEDTREAEEYTLLAGLDDFSVIPSNTKATPDKRLVIPYTEFAYPQFVNEDSVYEELKDRIQKFFKSEDKLPLLCYSMAEELRIKQILVDNIREYDLDM